MAGPQAALAHSLARSSPVPARHDFCEALTARPPAQCWPSGAAAGALRGCRASDGRSTCCSCMGGRARREYVLKVMATLGEPMGLEVQIVCQRCRVLPNIACLAFYMLRPTPC